MSLKEALFHVALWMAIACGFGIWIWIELGKKKGLAFFTGYLLEYSLSIDNLFLFLLIFRAFDLNPVVQAYCLRLGILGALILRGALIWVGSVLVQRFSWMLYIFGALLIVTGLKILLSRKDEIKDPRKHFIFRFCRKFFPISNDFNSTRLLVRQGKKWALTPVAITIVIVEFTDLLFALDSVPAIFAISTDPLIIYSSNICAILGLRSLYFVLAGIMERFVYLSYGLGVLLLFVGFKMLAAPWIHLSEAFCLLFIAVVLAVTMLASYLKTRTTTTRTN